MGKRDLIERVIAVSGHKKKDAKPLVEATLAILGDMLAEGHDLNLPGFGKVKVTRRKEGVNGQVMTARIRQPSRTAPARGTARPDPLAPRGE